MNFNKSESFNHKDLDKYQDIYELIEIVVDSKQIIDED
jgi:hypothetical protein